MPESNTQDLKVLEQIRERRLDQAELDKRKAHSKLQEAIEQVEIAKQKYETAKSQMKAKIDAIYNALINGDPHKINAVDKAKLAEALIHEEVASLKKDILNAEQNKKIAEDEYTQASQKVVKLIAEKEAVNLLIEEQSKLDVIEQERQADEALDEFAEQMTQRNKK